MKVIHNKKPSRLKITKQHHANIVDALTNMLPSIPEANIIPRLEEWRRDPGPKTQWNIFPPTCGTLACFGGWCLWWPRFRKQGLSVGYAGGPIVPYEMVTAAEKLFGDPDIFNRRGMHRADRHRAHLTDHAIIVNRLQWLLNNSEVVIR